METRPRPHLVVGAIPHASRSTVDGTGGGRPNAGQRRYAMGKLIAALMAAILGFVLVITSIGWLGSKLTHAVERQPTMPIVACWRAADATIFRRSRPADQRLM